MAIDPTKPDTPIWRAARRHEDRKEAIIGSRDHGAHVPDRQQALVLLTSGYGIHDLQALDELAVDMADTLVEDLIRLEARPELAAVVMHGFMVDALITGYLAGADRSDIPAED